MIFRILLAAFHDFEQFLVWKSEILDAAYVIGTFVGDSQDSPDEMLKEDPYHPATYWYLDILNALQGPFMLRKPPRVAFTVLLANFM